MFSSTVSLDSQRSCSLTHYCESAAAALLPLVKELKRELYQPRRLRLLYLSEIWRTDIAIRQPEICMIQEVEELGPELKLFRFRYLDVLESRKVPVGIARPLHDVASRRPKRAGISYRLERIRVEPFCGCLRA